MQLIRGILFSGLLLPIVVGCGPSAVSVHGTVTANGKPIEEGEISFHPSDGKNSTYGATIAKGAYKATVNPGKYTVVISGGGKATAYPKSQEDLKKMTDKELEATAQIPADAKGNNQEVEIKGGQELNFSLEFSSR